MKIAVMGSHGTGKSTLCKGLAKHFKLNLIPDVIPEAHRLRFPINEKTLPETQLWILSKQLELERNTPSPWIMEKSLWDNIVYGSYSIKLPKIISIIRNIVKKNARYNLVLYCPIEFPITYDGLRSLNVDFQKTIDIKLRKLLEEEEINFTEINGNKKTRLQQAVGLINKFLKKF